jgi:ATP-dependent Zn protease
VQPILKSFKTSSLSKLCKEQSIQLKTLTAPQLKDTTHWNYTTFLYNVSNNEIESVIITQDQKNITVKFKNNSEKNLLLPEGYDIISYLVSYNIPIYIQLSKKSPIELSVFDITLIICQCVFLYYVIKTILSKKPFTKVQNDTIDLNITPINYSQSLINDNPTNSNDLEIAAYRESGKLISNLFSNNINTIDSISINEQKSFVATNKNPTRQDLEDRLKIILGGRVAEEIIFGALRSSSGKSTDAEIAIQLAYDIIATYGFSQQMGITEWDSLNTPQIQKNIEKSVRRILVRSYREIRKFIIKNKDLLDVIAGELLIKKTLYKEDIRQLILKFYKTSRKINNKIIKHLNITNHTIS